MESNRFQQSTFLVALALVLALVGCGQAGPTSSALGSGSSTSAVVVGLEPSTATTAALGTIPFVASVHGAASTTVSWSVAEPGGGTVDASGVYRAPSTPGVYHVIAAVVGDPAASGSAPVTVTAGAGAPSTGPAGSPGPVAIFPATLLLATGQSATFTATTAPSDSVTWSVAETSGCGAITAAGLYTAPAAPANCHVVATGVASAGPGATASVTIRAAGAPPLGVNLSQVTDWDPTQMFADVMKHARHFGSVGQPSDEAAPVDANGWPTGDAGVVVMVNLPDMAGTYALSFTGKASVSLNAALDPTSHVAGLAYDAASNTSTASVVVGAAEQNLFLVFQGQPGGVKNVRLMRPGHAPGELFNRQFLARLARFQTLRFMDYLQTNNNSQVNWTDRHLPTSASEQRTPSGGDVGASWEYVVLLANQAGKDIWINVPYGATDDYVTRLAQLLRYGSDGVNPYTAPQASPAFPPLAPDRAIYVEWSNELWNGGFSQSGALGSAADAAIAASDPDLLYDGNTNHYSIMFRIVGRRTMQISNLFRAVFGDADMLTRVRPVLPGQLANSDTIAQPLNYLAAMHGGAAKYVYAAAGAPYVTVPNDDAGTLAGLTLDTIFSGMATYEANNLLPWMQGISALCQKNGIKMVAYEGGQHLYGTGSEAAKLAAQMDPRMTDILVSNYQNWFASGGDLFVYYSVCSGWNQWGSWGLSDNISSEATPKWTAISETFGSPQPAP